MSQEDENKARETLEQDLRDFELAAHPHDAFIKKAFSDLDCAGRFFRSHLPPAIAAQADWSTLVVVPGSFVRHTLQQTHSDLLYTVSTGEGQMLLHLLFEQQSTVDPAMPLRLLGYMTEIWNAWVEKHGLPLPPVIPFVLHLGPQGWTPSCSFQDLVCIPTGLAGELRSFIPSFRHALLDLSSFDPLQGESDVTIRIILQLLKKVREEKRLLQFFDWLAAELTIHPNAISVSLFHLSLLYAVHAEVSIDVEAIAHKLTRNPELHTEAMNTAQQLIQKGRQEGRQEGRNHGEWCGQLKLLQRIMGLPVTPDEELIQLDADDVKERFQALEREYDSKFKGR